MGYEQCLRVYDASFLLLIISPLLINAFDYMLLGRMVTFFLGSDTKIGGIRGSKMGVIFVCFDIISFIVQLGGGVLSLSKTVKTANLGLHVYTGGVVFQQALIVCFLCLTIAFQKKLRYCGTDSSKRGARTLLHVLRFSLCLITYRIIFRIVEFSSSQGSTLNVYINHHEYFVYVFDAAPMFFALIIMNIWHPGKILQEDLKGSHSRVASDDRVALQQFPPQPYAPSYPPQPYTGARYEGA
ncbi:putative lipid transporter atnI [Hyphodiscus hymeniophilus]|uniref:Lipid transporter atnI n=1 Tax=Hyphodiscus hymeniophilus TaxID=353542 RepID=A0A9P6VNE8_9HELO|nr:putative lipid transporter atnI [Hyphodiscus hymeniophilus]